MKAFIKNMKLGLMGLLIWEGLSAQPNLSNQGIMSVKPGTTFFVKGNFENQAGASFTQNGQMTLEGNFINQGTTPAPQAGYLDFRGTQIGGASNARFYTLKLNSTGNVTLTGNSHVEVTHQLEFIAGILLSNANNLVIFQEGAQYTGADRDHFIQGPAQKNGSEDFIFPIGDNGYYKPCGIRDLSGSESFQAEFFYQTPPNHTVIDTVNANGMIAVSHCEYWDISRSGTQSAKVVIYYDDTPYFAACSTEVTDKDALMIAHYDGTDWDGNAGTSEGNNDQGFVRMLNPTDQFSFFTLGFNDGLGSVLAGELSFFKVEGSACEAEFSWATLAEAETAFFLIEQSRDAKQFAVLATIDAQGKAGNYFTGISTTEPGNYYRLGIVKKDGNIQYSPIKFAEICQEIALSMYPNPASEFIRVQIRQPELLTGTQPYRILDIRGKIVGEGIIPQTGNLSLNVTGLPDGNYVLQTSYFQKIITVLR